MPTKAGRDLRDHAPTAWETPFWVAYVSARGRSHDHRRRGPELGPAARPSRLQHLCPVPQGAPSPAPKEPRTRGMSGTSYSLAVFCEFSQTLLPASPKSHGRRPPQIRIRGHVGVIPVEPHSCGFEPTGGQPGPWRPHGAVSFPYTSRLPRAFPSVSLPP